MRWFTLLMLMLITLSAFGQSNRVPDVKWDDTQPTSAIFKSSVPMVKINRGYGRGAYGTSVYCGHGVVLTAAHVTSRAQAATIISQIGNFTGTPLVARQGDLAAILLTKELNLPIVTIAPKDLEIGDVVYAAGYDHAEKYRIHRGKIVSFSRKSSWNNAPFAMSGPAGAISGNSGGPVFNEHGQLVGIISGSYEPSGKWGYTSWTNTGVIRNFFSRLCGRSICQNGNCPIHNPSGGSNEDQFVNPGDKFPLPGMDDEEPEPQQAKPKPEPPPEPIPGPVGPKGDDGRGIVSIQRNSATGEVHAKYSDDTTELIGILLDGADGKVTKEHLDQVISTLRQELYTMIKNDPEMKGPPGNDGQSITSDDIADITNELWQSIQQRPDMFKGDPGEVDEDAIVNRVLDRLSEIQPPLPEKGRYIYITADSCTACSKPNERVQLLKAKGVPITVIKLSLKQTETNEVPQFHDTESNKTYSGLTEVNYHLSTIFP